MLTLRSGQSSVVVAPEYGAGLLGWMRGPVSLLRRALPGAVAGDANMLSCFPMLPYANRVGGARFTWGGEAYDLARNFGDQPHAIHGVGWQRAWTVDGVSGDTATLALSHRPDRSWPFAFDAQVAYRLTDSALTVTLALTNRQPGPAPAGIGLHPYFPNAGDPSLRFNAAGVWDNRPDGLPDRHGPVPAEWSYQAPLAVSQTRLDNCFTGWDGTAEISAGPASLRIEASEAFGNVQVFTPHWADFFCVEPVSHVPDAINLSGQRMHALGPGETLRGTIRLSCPA